jgi:hypothetical protein
VQEGKVSGGFAHRPGLALGLGAAEGYLRSITSREAALPMTLKTKPSAGGGVVVYYESAPAAHSPPAAPQPPPPPPPSPLPPSLQPRSPAATALSPKAPAFVPGAGAIARGAAAGGLPQPAQRPLPAPSRAVPARPTPRPPPPPPEVIEIQLPLYLPLAGGDVLEIATAADFMRPALRHTCGCPVKDGTIASAQCDTCCTCMNGKVLHLGGVSTTKARVKAPAVRDPPCSALRHAHTSARSACPEWMIATPRFGTASGPTPGRAVRRTCS